MKFSKAFIVLVFGFVLPGCLPFPILNHADSTESLSSSDRLNADCPLLLERHSLCVGMEWLQIPTENVKGAFWVRFWDRSTGSANAGPYFSPLETVAVKLWMPTMGHGSSPVAVAPAVNGDGEPITGVYLASDVYFVMPGKWDVWIQLKDGKRVIEEVKFEYSY